MIEAEVRSSRFKFATALVDVVRVGASEIVREATPEEFRPPSRRRPEYKPLEFITELVDPQQQAAVDTKRLAEVRGLLRAFVPQQGQSQPREKGRMVSQPAMQTVRVVRNRG